MHLAGSSHRWQSLAAALIAAVALHAIFLAIRLVQPTPATPVVRLKIRIQAPAAEPEVPIPHTDTTPADDIATADSVTRPAKPNTDPPTRPSPVLPAKPVPLPEPADKLPNSRVLMQAARAQARKQAPQASAPQAVRLGQVRPSSPPPNWTRDHSFTQETPFVSVWLPQNAVILDRWRNPDGSHQVIVKTPSGNTYCGKAAAYDPLEPLVEPVMLFKSC